MVLEGRHVDKERKNATTRAWYWRNRERCLERTRKQREAPGYKEYKRQNLREKKIKILTHDGGGMLAGVQ